MLSLSENLALQRQGNEWRA